MEEKLIAWAFVCAQAETDEHGGVNATHIDNKFLLSDLAGLSLVICVEVPKKGSGGRQAFSLGIRIKTRAQKEVKTHASDLQVTNQIFVLPLGPSITQPGRHTVEIFVDGSLQQSLEFFVL